MISIIIQASYELYNTYEYNLQELGYVEYPLSGNKCKTKFPLPKDNHLTCLISSRKNKD